MMQIPPGFWQVNPKIGAFDDISSTLSIPDPSATGASAWRVDEALPGPFLITATLVLSGSVLAESTLLVERLAPPTAGPEGGQASGWKVGSSCTSRPER